MQDYCAENTFVLHNISTLLGSKIFGWKHRGIYLAHNIRSYERLDSNRLRHPSAPGLLCFPVKKPAPRHHTGWVFNDARPSQCWKWCNGTYNLKAKQKVLELRNVDFTLPSVAAHRQFYESKENRERDIARIFRVGQLNGPFYTFHDVSKALCIDTSYKWSGISTIIRTFSHEATNVEDYMEMQELMIIDLVTNILFLVFKKMLGRSYSFICKTVDLGWKQPFKTFKPPYEVLAKKESH
jgi:hypothetical protein